VPVRIADDHQRQRHTIGGAFSRGLCQVECTIQRRVVMDDSSTESFLQELKAGQCLEQMT
jgi:hypothetical protein